MQDQRKELAKGSLRQRVELPFTTQVASPPLPPLAAVSCSGTEGKRREGGQEREGRRKGGREGRREGEREGERGEGGREGGKERWRDGGSKGQWGRGGGASAGGRKPGAWREFGEGAGEVGGAGR